MAMIETVLSFNGSATPNKGPDWFDRPFWSMERLPGQLMGLGGSCGDGGALCGLGASNTVSDHAAVDKAEALYKAAGFNANCREDLVGSPGVGMSYYNRVCSINGKDGFGVDNVVYSYPNGLPAHFIQTINEGLGLTNVYSDPKKDTRYDPPPVTGGSGGGGTGTINDGQEAAAAKKSLTDAMDTLGVGGNQAILAKLNAEFTKGLVWWLQSHKDYTGLSAYTAAGAVSTVRQWIKDLGITAPPPADKVPAPTGSGQGGNADTPNAAKKKADEEKKKADDKSGTTTDNKIFGMDSTTFLLIAAAGVGVMVMQNKGRR